MNKILELVKAAPRIAGVKDHEQFSFIAGKIYDADAAKLTELFDRKPDWKIEDRLRFLFLWVFSEKHNEDIGGLLYYLAVFAAWSIDINNGRAKKTEKYEAEAVRLTDELNKYPEIEAILSVQEASALLGWAPGEVV